MAWYSGITDFFSDVGSNVADIASSAVSAVFDGAGSLTSYVSDITSNSFSNLTDVASASIARGQDALAAIKRLGDAGAAQALIAGAAATLATGGNVGAGLTAAGQSYLNTAMQLQQQDQQASALKKQQEAVRQKQINQALSEKSAVDAMKSKYDSTINKLVADNKEASGVIDGLLSYIEGLAVDVSGGLLGGSDARLKNMPAWLQVYVKVTEALKVVYGVRV